MAYTAPTTAVQVSFTDPYDTPDWVDITTWAKSGSTKRGRQHELQRAVAGTCKLTISNQDGRFSTFNTASPYVNILSGADSYFFGVTPSTTYGSSQGNYGTTTNCTLALLANQGFDGYSALAMKSTASGDMICQTPTGTSGYAATAGTTYGFQAQFETAASARSCVVGVIWYTSGGAQIGAAHYGSAVTDAMGSYTKATLTFTAPATTAFMAIVVKVESTGAANEIHYVARLLISQGDNYGGVTTGWAPGGRGLVPARPVRVLATWSATQYPVFYGYVDSWVPSYGVSTSTQVISCTDGLNLLALSYLTKSDYRTQLLADSAVGLWMLNDAVTTPVSPLSAAAADSVAPATVNGGAVGALPLVLATGIYPDGYSMGQPGLLASDTSTSCSLTSAAFETTSSIYYGTTGLTAECMVEGANLSAIPASTAVVELQGLAGNYFLAIDGSGTLWARLPGPGLFSTSGSIADGKPHHIAMTASSGGSYAIYIDGVSVASGSCTPPGANQYNFTVFGPSAGLLTASLASFTVAGVGLFETALSAGTIATHSTLGHNGYVLQQSGQRIAAVLNTLGVPASLQSLATGISAVQAPTSSLVTTPALSYIQTVENTEQGFFYVDEAGIFTYRDRHYILLNAAATTSNGTFGPNNNPYTAGSIVPADDALDLWNDAPVSAIANVALGVTGAVQNAPNANSRVWYRPRTKTGYQSMLQTTDAEALSLSQWIVAHYGLPIARVRQMRQDSTIAAGANLPQMLGRKLLDRITVIWQPIDGTGINFQQDSLIESIQHDFSPGVWTTTWGLSVAETQTYFTLNDASRGTLAATGATTGNRLGY